MESAVYSSSVIVLIGIISHVVYFNHGEHHFWGRFYIIVALFSSLGGPIVLATRSSVLFLDAFKATFTILVYWLVGVFIGLITYRTFLNRLNKFPGPFMAKVTGFWQPVHYRHKDCYHKLVELHQKYGDIVRIGPTELSIADADVFEAALGPNSKATKNEWYDIGAPLVSMQSTRDKTLHDKRRRIWSPAFSEKCLRDYEPKINKLNNRVVQWMEEHSGRAVNVTRLFKLHALGVMASLAFGKDYNTLESGKASQTLELLSEGMQPFAFRFPVWFFRILTGLPGLGSGFQKFLQFSIDELTWRVQNAPSSEKEHGVDIMTTILKAYENIEQPEKDLYLQADSRLIIVAGSETTAATFTYLFYYLAQNPEVVDNLRGELTPLICSSEWSDKNIRHASYLNACIFETLRLHPPVPSGIARKTPAEGLVVNGVSIPPSTSLWMPFHVIHRDERNFQDARSFIPERWTCRPNLVKHSNAWAPFSQGPFNCIGKTLALMELRTLTTALVQHFDVQLAQHENGHRLMQESLDHFSIEPGRLDLVFRERQSKCKR